MAKYSFTVSGSQLIVSLVPVLKDVQPTSMSYLSPSFKIGVGKINAYEHGQPRQSFLFTEIGEIDGVEPTDLQDAFDKLTTATANFNGGGAAPYKVYTALLTQSGTDAPVATVLENSAPINITYSYVMNGVFNISFPYPSNITSTKLAIILGKLVGEQGSAVYTYDSLGYSGGNITFNLKTKSNTSTFSNNLLIRTFIEIRVYN